MISVEEAKLILQDDTPDKDIQETINSLQLLVELMFDKQTEELKINKMKNIQKHTHDNTASKP